MAGGSGARGGVQWSALRRSVLFGEGVLSDGNAS